MRKEILDIQFDAAIQEIVAEAQLPLNKEIIETWLSDYEDLWFAMKAELGNLPVPLDIIHGRSMDEFHCIYSLFTDLKKYFELEVLCTQAMSEYDQITANSPHTGSLREWRLKYNELKREDLLISPISPGSLNFVRNIYGVTYFIAGSEFKNTMIFRNTFSHLFV